MAQNQPSNLPPIIGHTRVKAKDRVLEDNVYASPVDRWEYRFRRIGCAIVFGIILLIIVCAWRRFNRDSTEHYADIRQHCKYGSIGGEVGGTLARASGGLLPAGRIFDVVRAMLPD